MKKLLLLFALFVGFGAVQTVQAQAALVNLFTAGTTLGIRAIKNHKKTAEATPADQATRDKTAAANAAATVAGAPKELVQRRTPADKLPKKGAEQITALEAQLDLCHAAMLANPTGVVCTAEQCTAIQSAAVSVARAQSGWDLQAYQQELAFYQAEDVRRQQAAAPAAPANAPVK